MGLLKNIKAMMGDSFSKGDLFEEYVAELFPDNQFDIIEVTPRKENFDGRWVEQSFNPDLRIRHKASNHTFWVECKYRSSLYGGRLNWCERYQLDRYKRFQEERRPEKVYVVAGLEGKPNWPDKLFCMPLDELQYPELFPSIFKKFERPTDKTFYYYGGRLL